jgi:hypothetical protein
VADQTGILPRESASGQVGRVPLFSPVDYDRRAEAATAPYPGVVQPLSLARVVAVATSALACLAFIVMIQMAAGAYRSEAGSYSDEAAHFMNGLVVRDYLYSGVRQNPIEFARAYYEHYPKIAPLMWPPFYHVVLGLWLLPGWAPHGAAIFLVGVFGAWTAWRLYRMVKLFAGFGAAAAVAMAFMLSSGVAALTSAVMLDIVIAALAIEATYWLAVFFRTENWRHAAVFGLICALGCLTKGNGVAVVLVPLLMIPITRRYDLLRRSGLYIAAAIVVVLAVPLLVITCWFDAALGDFGPVTIATVLERTTFYLQVFWTQIGLLAVGLAGIGLAYSVYHGRKWDAAAGPPIPEALAALAVAAFLFHILNPHQIYAGRYIELAVAPLLGLLPVGLSRIADLIRSTARRQVFQATVLAAVVAVAFVARNQKPVVRAPLGFRAATTPLHVAGGLSGRRMLIVSDENGEGALVAEVAVAKTESRPTVIRGSKWLASDDWMGRNLTMRYASPADIIRALEDFHIDYVVMDSSPEAATLPYWRQMREAIAVSQDRIDLLYANEVNRAAGPTRPIAVYRVKYCSPGPPKKIEMNLGHKILGNHLVP